MNHSDEEIQQIAWRYAIKSSMSAGDHGSVKVSKFFNETEKLEINAISQNFCGLPVAAEWNHGELSWVLLTRTFLFRDATWKSVYPWDMEIEWGDFKGYDKVIHRCVNVKCNGSVVGKLTYEVGPAAMIPMNAIGAIKRLRRPNSSPSADA